MILHLLLWCLIGIPCMLLGLFIERRTCNCPFYSRADRLIVSLFSGLAIVSALLLALSLVLPVSLTALGLILAASLVLSLADSSLKREWQAFTSVKAPATAVFIFCAMLAAFSAADPIKIYDTGVYHYPLIRWLATVGTVPGVALLYGNFGFTSSWFALTAALDHGFLVGRVAGVFNGLVVLAAILHFSFALSRAVTKQASRADWFLLGAYPVIFAFCYQLNYHTSPSPDLPVLVFLVLIAWRIIVEGELRTTNDSLRCNLPLLILAGGIIDLKLSAIPILAFIVLLVTLRCRFAWRQVVPAVIIVALFAAPLFVANVVTSGYPLYPSSIFRTDFDWTLPVSAVTVMAEIIKHAAYCNGPCGQAIVGWNWLIPWLRNPQNQFILLVSATAGVMFGLRRAWRLGTHLSAVLMLAGIGITYVFFTVPNIRFALGYIALCSGLCVLLLKRHNEDFNRPHNRSDRLAFGIALVIIASFFLDSYVAGKSHVRYSALSQALIPEPLPIRTSDTATIKNRGLFRDVTLVLATETTNGLKYYRPIEGEQCWAAKLPCVPGELRSGVVLRDPHVGWRGGFVNASATGRRVNTALLRRIKF